VLIGGQDILTGKGGAKSEMILCAKSESDNIFDIYIVERKGNLAYVKPKPKVNASVHRLLAELSLDVNHVKVTELVGHFHISLPIYHTYGKVGIAVLSIK
jgi:hypothetical protein